MMQRCKPVTHHEFGLFPFRSPLLWESRLISFPSGTEMVQFPESHPTMAILFTTAVADLLIGRVTPFGNLRITGCLLLPAAFRSLPRPSSSDSSKASTIDPYSLDHISFSPFSSFLIHYVKEHDAHNVRKKALCCAFLFLEVWGFEPQTYGLQSHRSSQLSYTPITRSHQLTEMHESGCDTSPGENRQTQGREGKR